MKMKCMAIVFCAVFTMGQISCTTCHKCHIGYYSQPSIQPDKTYSVRFRNHNKTHNISGRDIVFRGNLIGIRFPDSDKFVFYQKNQIESLCLRKFSKGKTIGLVAGGGAAFAGFIIGLVYWGFRELANNDHE